MHRLHASCAARDGKGVLLLGASGAGKSDLLLRLVRRGYALIADDRVVLENGRVRCPERLQGLMEVRGLGIVRMPFETDAEAVLAVRLLAPNETFPRLPEEGARDAETGLPVLYLDPSMASAPDRVDVALDCLELRAFLIPQGDMPVADNSAQ